MLERIGYGLLGIVLLAYLGAIVYGMITAGPLGIFGFILIGGIGVLFIKVLKDRLNNKEDDFYSNNVNQ